VVSNLKTMEKYPRQIISSYGLMKANSFYCKPENYDELIDCINYGKASGLKINPTGSRQSFSNVCLVTDNISLDLKGLNNILNFVPEEFYITVQAGMLTTDLLSFLMPKGFTISALTGSPLNTIAGDISSDVNGKDSWKRGNFGENVIAMKVFRSNGDVMEITRISHPDLMDSIIAGLGLVAIIIEVTLRIITIPSMSLNTESVKCENLNHQLQTLDDLDNSANEFAYCWTDPFAPASNLGRGLCEKANFSSSLIKGNKQPESLRTRAIQKIPTTLFWAVFKFFDYKIFYQYAGYLKYHFAKKQTYRLVAFNEYQYPMINVLPSWNQKFVPKGFREWQILFPKESFVEAYSEILSFCQSQNFTPYVCAIRKHKPQSPYLSFSGDGYSMTINYDLNLYSTNQIEKVEQALIFKILKYKGRVYLSKFPFFSPQEVHKMYPNYHKFVTSKGHFDRIGLFWSNAAETLL